MSDQAPVFIAADALVARHLAADPQHAQARQVWLWLAAERPPLITIPAVLDAAASQLAQRADPEFAAERARRWANSRALQVVVRPPTTTMPPSAGWNATAIPGPISPTAGPGR